MMCVNELQKFAKPTRPVLRWHGGKWKLAEWIISYFPTHRIYVEPFGGAASVLVRKQRSYAEVYNDLDSEVVGLFKVLRDPIKAARLKEIVELTPFSRVDFEESYEIVDCDIEQSRRLIIRSFMGFGSNAHNPKTSSGFRANSNRSGTTPAHDWVNWPSQIQKFTERLCGVVIENRDAKRIMQSHDTAETLHYVDPPYVKETRCKGYGYRHELTNSDHSELVEFLTGLKGMVVLSCYDHPIYDEKLIGWKKINKKALADGARERTESLYLSPNCFPHMLKLNV